VAKGSVIHVHRNVYSVHSRLLGQRVCKATITSPQRRQLVLLSDNYFSPVTAQLL
jgi:hypothetical protein